MGSEVVLKYFLKATTSAILRMLEIANDNRVCAAHIFPHRVKEAKNVPAVPPITCFKIGLCNGILLVFNRERSSLKGHLIGSVMAHGKHDG